MDSESAHREAIARSLGRCSKETDHQHLEIHDWIDARASATYGLRIGRLANLPDFLRKADLRECRVDPLVKSARRGSRQRFRLDPELLLPWLLSSLLEHPQLLTFSLCNDQVFQQAAREAGVLACRRFIRLFIRLRLSKARK